MPGWVPLRWTSTAAMKEEKGLAIREREPRRVRSARRRAAYHADRKRRASNPVERFKAARAALLSAVAHARNPARAARSVASDVATHAREVMARAELAGASKQLYERRLAGPGTDRERLGAALTCLDGAIGRLPDTERERVYEHYAHDLADEARRIEEEGR